MESAIPKRVGSVRGYGGGWLWTASSGLVAVVPAAQAEQAGAQKPDSSEVCKLFLPPASTDQPRAVSGWTGQLPCGQVANVCVIAC